MDEKDYKEQFEALASGLELEKAYDALADRAELARTLAMHCGRIYKTARAAGLSRSLSAGLACDYWTHEMTPENVYIVEEGDL
jgi:hypothetical protein